jgi:hypothetical protein
LRDGDAETSPVDPWGYEPPEVAYVPIVKDDKVVGYKVEPEFGLTWPHIQTLRHFASLIEHRTGIKIRVIKVDDIEDCEAFEVLTGHSTGGPAPYEVTFAWLSGFENGIHEFLWGVKKEDE